MWVDALYCVIGGSACHRSPRKLEKDGRSLPDVICFNVVLGAFEREKSADGVRDCDGGDALVSGDWAACISRS